MPEHDDESDDWFRPLGTIVPPRHGQEDAGASERVPPRLRTTRSAAADPSPQPGGMGWRPFFRWRRADPPRNAPGTTGGPYSRDPTGSPRPERPAKTRSPPLPR